MEKIEMTNQQLILSPVHRTTSKKCLAPVVIYGTPLGRRRKIIAPVAMYLATVLIGASTAVQRPNHTLYGYEAQVGSLGEKPQKILG